MRACHAIDGAASEDDAAGILMKFLKSQLYSRGHSKLCSNLTFGHFYVSGTEVEGAAEDEEDEEEGEEREEGFFLDLS